MRHASLVTSAVVITMIGAVIAACGGSSKAECVANGDCAFAPEAVGVCRVGACVGGQCVAQPLAAGTVLPAASQTAGDCKVAVCDGAGGITSANSDADAPASLSCQVGVCTAGTPSQAPQAAGTACAAGGGVVCDGAGTCVECVANNQCASSVCTPAHTCASATCNDAVQNGTETDVDCGGGACVACGSLKRCLINADCASGVCNGTTCQ